MCWPNDSGTPHHFLCQLLCPDNHIPLSGSDRVSSLLSWLMTGLLKFPVSCVIPSLWTFGFAYSWPWNLGWCFLVTVTPIIAIPAHYCEHNIINHFSYEIQALLKLVCLDTHASLILGLVISVFILPLPFNFILMSYFHIVDVMLKIHSMEARLKAFSICRSHLTIATIFYGIVIYMYLKLSQRNLRKKANSSQYFIVQLLPCLHPEK